MHKPSLPLVPCTYLCFRPTASDALVRQTRVYRIETLAFQPWKGCRESFPWVTRVSPVIVVDREPHVREARGEGGRGCGQKMTFRCLVRNQFFRCLIHLPFATLPCACLPRFAISVGAWAGIGLFVISMLVFYFGPPRFVGLLHVWQGGRYCLSF